MPALPINPPGTMPDGSHWQGIFEHRYTSAISGCSVYSEQGWIEAENSHEEKIAKLLADNGLNSVLRRVVSIYTKNPDAYLITAQGTATWEFEQVTLAAQNLPRAISQALREGKKQAENVVLYVDRHDISDDILQRGIRSAFFADLKEELRAIIVLRRNGVAHSLSRQEVLDHENFLS